jgi:hypothetical protein
MVFETFAGYKSKRCAMFEKYLKKDGRREKVGLRMDGRIYNLVEALHY